MKIYVEREPASKEETAYWDGESLFIQYHKWTKDIYDYIDAIKLIHILDFERLVMVFGKRGGFKKLVVHHKGEEFELSSNHKRLCVQVYNCIRQVNLPVIKEVR